MTTDVLRTALMFQAGNLVGREYISRLVSAGRTPELCISVGQLSDVGRERELNRSGGQWSPSDFPVDLEITAFTSLDEPGLIQIFEDNQIDVAINGGLGLVREPLLSTPRIGFLNMHPGALPKYRGAMCPEWAILEGNPVITTAHLMAAEIDAGPIVHTLALPQQTGWTYETFRAAIYPHAANVMVEALEILGSISHADVTSHLQVQDEDGAIFRRPMTDAQCATMRAKFPLR